MKTCFKKVDDSATVYCRCIKLDGSSWLIADKLDVSTEFNGIFINDEGESHRLDDIAEIGIDFVNGEHILCPVYVYSDELNDKSVNECTYKYRYDKKPINVFEKNNVKIIIDYLNKNLDGAKKTD